ncbi:hypothetical protein [Pseudaminobacter sp. NGMCC 1.201702]|uniref:hypothetical protein n=1 Tax=Pseudaminobacter sp. NGMCC 1.201702 TaxID=3391825 RepID=UPI0039F0650F
MADTARDVIGRDLIAKLEKLDGPSEILDEAIWEAVGGWPEREWRSVNYMRLYGTPVTASLDAAIALVERVLPGWAWTIMAAKPLTSTRAGETVAKGPFTAFVNNSPRRPSEPDAEYEGVGATPAIALLIALLKEAQDGR